ncbi:FtsX-like permease family protein [Agrobacterium tumefaciens]|uniref:FtsX-like permease family protein n=1 Tax=Agrobacterium tumefaciens complex TaxID=1183400 RepID=UPI001572B09D|nr:FtsX-like permease family protein [Agrobacterium fabrum]NSZ09709.1 FtsX-like permease family protein [Agrobacterium tumefaciens]
MIVGVTGELSGSLGDDKRPQFYIPYASSFVRISGNPRLSEIVVRVNTEVDAIDAESAMAALLEKRHGVRDFFTFNSDKIRRTIEKTTRMFSILVVSIAAIALLVGGVGVMNIMLISVTERTGEIGLRLAVGARQSDIRQQFVIEAIVITGAGSVAGVALSYCLEALASFVEMPIPLVISPKAVAVGCVMALSIGIIFGFFPARKASRINPVEALAKA